MTKITYNKLTMYRRHAGGCAAKESKKLDQCECPIWCHGKLRGEFLRQSLDTRVLATASAKVKDMLERGNDKPDSLAPVAAPAGGMTVEYAIQQFLGSNKKLGRLTKLMYERSTGSFLEWCRKHDFQMLSHFDTSHIVLYFNEACAHFAINTTRSRLVQLRVFFNYCQSRGWIQTPPTANRRLMQTLTGRKGAPGSTRVPFTPEQITSILAAVDLLPEGERDKARAMILLLLYTGMRISDLTFFEREYLTACAGSRYADYWIIKTRRRITIPPEVNARVVAALAKLPASRVYYFQEDAADDYRPARAALRAEMEFSPLMPDYDNRVARATALVVKVLRLAGIEEGACHRFRDTFAVNMLTGDGVTGADIYTVSKMLGHSDVKITDQHYMKLVPGYRERMSKSTRVLAYQFPAESGPSTPAGA